MSAWTFWLTTLLVAGAVFATRFPGLLLARPPAGPLGRGLDLVPAAVFATLAVPPLLLGGGEALTVRADLLLAGGATAIVADASRRFDLAVAAGLVMAGLCRVVGLH